MPEERPKPKKREETKPNAKIKLAKQKSMEEKLNETPTVFSQMSSLHIDANGCEWRETARWLKYEENVEEFCKRWSKPHVSSLSAKSVLDLKRLLRSAYVCLDIEASTLKDVIENIIKAWGVNHSHLTPKMTEQLWDVLLARHKHVHLTRKMFLKDAKSTETKGKNRWTFGEINVIDNVKISSIKTDSLGCLPLSTSESSFDPNSAEDCLYRIRENTNMVRKISKDVEICNILVGELASLREPLIAFVRLPEATLLGDICEVRRPTKFIYICLCPNRLQQYREVGRTMGSLMASKSFREVAYACDSKFDLIDAVDDFLCESTLLPRETWDPSIRLEPPPTNIKTETNLNTDTQNRKNDEDTNKNDTVNYIQESAETASDSENDTSNDSNLRRTGRLFGGLMEDIRRKSKWYLSDFTDATHIQCFATTIYIFLATLSPNVTFGGLLGLATDYNMAAIECLFAAGITGVVFALFAGQPLNILGSTGPMLIMESILYSICKDYGWDFMPIRVWIGLWTFLILMLIVAFDLSLLIRYVTRFTEETFACLIALIFIYEAHLNMYEISLEHPVNRHGEAAYVCAPAIRNQNDLRLPEREEVNQIRSHISGDGAVVDATNDTPTLSSRLFPTTGPVSLREKSTLGINTTLLNRTFETGTFNDCGHCVEEGPYVPDVLLLSLLLFVGTFIVARAMERFRTSGFFPQIVRRTISDFGVLISILSMVTIDMYMGINTPKLIVPSEFKPTRPDRGWIINPFSEKNPKWLPFVGCVPALLSALLIFMDQQITAVIVNRKENKLKKGGGYHLDLAVVAILIAVCSIVGLPWYVAATVSAIVHSMALRKESECVAPGEPISFSGVREQRVTALLVGILNGISVLFTPILQCIPMPVLYGVFLYMGVTSLRGMQLIDRTFIMFQPVKHQPDHQYLRHVAVKRVHAYTGIQIVCLIVLWVVKSIKSISILFPLMVVAICFVRKAMDFIFTDREMYWLDSILPSMKKDDDAEDMKENGDINNPAFVGSNTDLNRKMSNQQANLVREYNGKLATKNTLNPNLLQEGSPEESVSARKSSNEENRKSTAIYVSKL